MTYAIGCCAGNGKMLSKLIQMKKKNLKKQIVKISKDELSKIKGGKVEAPKIEVGVTVKF